MADDADYVNAGAEHLLTLMQMRVVHDAERGRTLEMDLRPEVTNPHGSLHGGLMGALIECGAAGCAVETAESENIVATDMDIRFMRTVKVGPARVVAKALRKGRRSVVVQADVIDVGSDQSLVASAFLTYALLG